MAVDIPLDLDSGPIVWVKAELDATLLAALDGIARLQAGESGNLSATVRSNLHKAAGAFELVGVEGFAVLLREFEQHLPDAPENPRPEALQTIASACRRLVAHLEEIAVGTQPVPLRFLPEYLALGRLREVRFGPADLFFPDLSRKPRFKEITDAVEPSKLASYLLRHRRDFQRGFLDWLRGNASASGLALMQQALAGIEQAHPLPAQRSFWWAASALLDAVQKNSVESSTSVKQLFARIDLQIRRLVEGSTKVADRLKREVLYHVSRVGEGSDACSEVKALYSLDVLVPKRVPRELDVVALRPAIDRLNETVGRCKDEWGAVSTNRSGAPERLAAALSELPAACDAIGLRSLSELGAGLADVASLISSRSLNDEASLEFASCLLLLETSTQHLAALPKTFPNEVNTALKRLGYATSRAPIPAELVDAMGSGSLTRLAQERETIAQVCREIRTNMRQIESALDAVFRDSTAVEDLGQIPGLLAQVSGALRLLGWNDAHHIIQQVSQRVSTMLVDTSNIDAVEIDRIANALAGFGFYVDARERKEAGAEAILESLGRTLRGESAIVVEDAPEHSVEVALGSRIRALKSDVVQLKNSPTDERLRASVASGLNDIRRDAELLDDASLASAAKSGLNVISGDRLDFDLLQNELRPVLGNSEPAAAVSAETQRLLDVPVDSQDDALLEIFIEEAGEVVGNIEASMAEYAHAPARNDLLRDVRRGFHTLKGSGRMVGLHTLGEAAWNVERVLNPVLEEGRSLSGSETELVNVATKQFKLWVAELVANGRALVDPHTFDALVEKCGHSVATPPTGAAQAAPVAVAPTPAPAPVTTSVPSTAAPAQSTAEISGLATFAAAATALGATAFAEKSKSSVFATPAPTDSGVGLESLFEKADFAAPTPSSAPNEAAATPADLAWFDLPTTEAAATPLPALEVEEISFESLADSKAVEIAPIAAPVAPAPVAPAFSLPAWSDELELDGVRVSRTLFSIMGDEARSHLNTLDQELSLMQFDPSQLPSDSMVRASHTLCGIHRTAGFGAIGDLAGHIEEALVAVRQTKKVEENLSLLSDAIETLRSSVLRLQTQTPTSESERHLIAVASDRLETFVSATGGTGGGAAAEMARESARHEAPSFEIEDEIAIDIPENFRAPIGEIAPVSVAIEAAPPPVESHTPAVDQQQMTEVDAPVALPLAETAAFGVGAAMLATSALAGSTSESAPATGGEPAEIAIPAQASSPTADPIGATPLSTAIAAATVFAAPPQFPQPPKASSVPLSTEDPLVGINDDIDVQVLPIFLEEAQELFPTASAEIRTLRASPNDKNNLDSLKRTLHTLKGSARMAGAMRLGELTHIVESAVAEKHGDWTDADLNQVEERFDDVAYVLDALVAGKYDVALPRFAKAEGDVIPDLIDDESITAPAIAAPVAADATAGTVVPTQVTEAAPQVSVTAAAIAAAKASITAEAPKPALATTTAVAPESAVAYLRVRTDSVELLADEAGEIAINRSRIESELRGLKTSLADLTSFVVRLRTLLREIEIQGESQIQSRLDQESTFDPLEFDRYTRFQELTRSLAEGVNDVGTVQQNLLKNIDDAETALAAQTRLSRSVQLRLQSLRTVPFSTVTERLYRVLRQTAKDVGKRANLDIVGGRIEIDRGVLERLIPVLEHLVRNSFAHGIEPTEVREAAGKPAIGEINIAVKQQGNEVAIEFTDDGSGISLERVRQRAIRVGLAQADEPLNDAQLIEFIFRPGFTTADAVTAISGRGVGMDVVRSELAALGGRVVAATAAGVGTKFTLSVPLTLAVTQVLLVESAGTVYAIPSSLIETVRQVPARERVVALAAKQFDVAGKFVPYRSMSVLLGGRPDATVHKSYPVAFLRAGDATAAIEVDKVIGNQEVVAKPYGPQLARVPGMAGLTVLGDGKIVLLMDPIALLRASAAGVATAALASASASAAATTPAPAAVTPMATSLPAAASGIVTTSPAPAIPMTDALADATSSESAATASTPSDAITRAPEPIAPPAPVPVVAAAAAAPIEPELPLEVIGRLPIVLVVDDSLTVRKITSRLLEREGYKAITAKDGLDALQVLSDVNPDVILLDIEMPRMDGFEFTKTIKADNRQNNIPIIMITSRTAEKHRNHAKELGVDEYLGKPYQDDQLLGLIGKYTANVVRPN